MIFEARKYRLIGQTPILGGQPADEAIRTRFVASRAPEAELSQEERDLFAAEREDTAGLTVFARDAENNDRPILLDYMVRGYFKSAIGALQKELGIKSYKSKVDKYLFVRPRRIPIMRDDDAVLEEDELFERTLRAETLKGPRVALQASEMIDTPWYIDIEIRLIPNNESKKTPSLTWDVIETALDYGEYCGIGQFRNGSYGRFGWIRLEGEA